MGQYRRLLQQTSDRSPTHSAPIPFKLMVGPPPPQAGGLGTDHTHLGQLLTYLVNLEAKTAIWVSAGPVEKHT